MNSPGFRPRYRPTVGMAGAEGRREGQGYRLRQVDEPENRQGQVVNDGFRLAPRGAGGLVAALRPVGYKVGLELMVRGPLRVGEVPMAFDDRRGKSKLGWRQRLDYLRHWGRLYAHVLTGALRRSAPRR